MRNVALVMGEALVDVVRHDGGEVARPGGSAANAAVALSRLGRETWFAGAWGDDEHGTMIAEHLAGSGVRLAGDPHQVPRTSQAVAHIGADGAAAYTFSITTPVPSPDLPAGVEPVVLMCGSIAAIAEPGAGVVRHALEAHAGRALRYYDINVRPQVTGTGADVVRAVEELVALADLVKASDEDLRALWPGATEGKLAERVLTAGAAAFVVTKGEHGSTWWSSRGRVDAPMSPVDVVDTIGAGDTFGAAMVDALWSLEAVGGPATTRLAALSVEDVTGVLRHAAAAAAITVSRAGADPPYAAELSG